MTKPPLERQQMAQVLNVSLQAGRILLENGGNTALVEETVHRLGTALGADWMEVYVTPSGIIASLLSDEEHRTRIQRVTRSGVQLAKLARVLELVEQAERLSVAEIGARLQGIEESPRHYGPLLTALAVGLACAAFAVNFGGTPRDFAVVWLTSTLAQLLRHNLAHTRLGRVLSTAVVAAFASATALALSAGTSSVSAAAAILLLVPGVPLVSSTADLFRGDVIAGTARAVSALITIMAGSAGLWAVVLAFGREFEKLVLPGHDHLWLAGLMGAVAAAGFAVLFDVPPRFLPACALVGFLAVLTRAATLGLGWPAEVANLLAGVAIGLSGEGLSRWLGTRYSLLAIPGYIPLVPGAVFFAGILHLVSGNYPEGIASLVRAGLILVAVALGMGSIPALIETQRKAMA